MAATELHEMAGAVVLADEEAREIAMYFEPRDSDPPIGIAIPAGAVGPFIAQMAAAYQKLAMKPDDKAGAFAPLSLTGARAAEAPDGTPVLLLQIEGSFELAVLVTRGMATALSGELERLHEGQTDGPLGRH